MAEFRDLSSLLDPQSIAIVGASPKSGWPARIWSNLQRFEYGGKIYPVNPNYETIWGMRCYASLDELPEVVDHAIIIVPAARLVELLRQSHRTPFRSATIYSGGFGEGGDTEGLKRKEFLQAYAREKGVHFCGPNCMGLVSTRSRAILFPDVRLSEMREGGLAIVSQSGGLLGGLVRAMISQGIGLSYFVTSGNEADAELSDYLRHFLKDENTKVLAAFIEGIKDAEKFLQVAGEALERAKPIIVLKIGRSEEGVAAALAHTGALAGNDRVFDAVCSQNGIIRVNDLDELLNTAELFLRVNRLPTGKKAAFVTFSGGLRGLLSDLGQDAGVEMPPLQPETEKKLAAMLAVGTAIGNPLDTGWGGLSSQEIYLSCVDALLADAGIDLLAMQEELPLSSARPDKESNLLALAKVAEKSSKPISVFSMVTQSLNDYGREFKERCPLPFVQGADNAVKAQKHLGNFAAAVRLYHEKKSLATPSLKPLSAKAKEALAKKSALNEWESYPLLAEYGIPLAKVRFATTVSDAVRAAGEIGYPVALKLVAPGVTHKTELDGVRLNLSKSHEVEAAWKEIEQACKNHSPGEALTGLLIQEMVSGGVETIIGTDNDPQFGPVVMFGLGGQSVEIYRDVTFRVAPIALDDAKQMIRSIKGFPLLTGFRGRRPVDLDALSRALVAVSQMAFAGAGLIQSIDINPFFCLKDGGKAVDAVIVTRKCAEQNKKD